MHVKLSFCIFNRCSKAQEDSCLFEAEKIGLELDYDPIGLDKNNLKYVTLLQRIRPDTRLL